MVYGVKPDHMASQMSELLRHSEELDICIEPRAELS